MKHCPTCNRTYEDEALSFCLTDGSSLIKDEAPAAGSFDPPPTILAPPPGSDWGVPSAGYSSPASPAAAWNSGGLPQQPAPAWGGGYQQPIGPPGYVQNQQNGFAISSLVCGVLSLVCCSIFTGIPAIILGIIAINKEKNDPQHYGGKGLAIGGIVLGSFSILILGLYLLAVLAGAIR